jgi:cell division protein FtsL
MGVEQAGLLIAVLLVLLLVIGSALGVIYSSYKSRQLFADLQRQNKETVRLEEEWGQLLLEQSTWASHERIEGLAKSQLNMVGPEPETIVVVKQ